MTDGPFIQVSSQLNEWSFQQSVNNVLDRRAVVIALALSAYKHDRGEYPKSLDKLVPDYLYHEFISVGDGEVVGNTPIYSDLITLWRWFPCPLLYHGLPLGGSP